MAVDTIDYRLLELKASRLGDYELKNELKLCMVQRDVAELHKNNELVREYNAWFEVLTAEIGLRGLNKAEASRSVTLYQLSAADIKARVDLVTYISLFVELHRSGLGRLVGRCPFHNDTVPSLMVYVNRQDWYCFGCNRGGDIFNFIRFYYDISFYEALELLSRGL